MKKLKNIIISIFLILIILPVSNGQEIILRQSNESGIYKKGESIKISASLSKPGKNSLYIKVLKNNTAEPANNQVQYNGNELLIFDKSFNEPCSIIIEVKTRSSFASLGAMVEPESITPGFSCPADFDEYWNREKKELRALPMSVKTVPVENMENGYLCTDTEINCTGPRPVRGYFARPFKAGDRSLPIVLLVHAAGVNGSWCLSRPEDAVRHAKMGKGAICFDLNAHGMLNGQPVEYYNNLNNNELKEYWNQGIESREAFYFRGMYLRLMRVLDFLTGLPQWDGRRILVIGESQGGGQALAAAGLDNRVTAVVATVPAMCDWGGSLSGRANGWPDPFGSKADRKKMTSVLPYFDAAHLLRNSKAAIVAEIGFIDSTCPSTSIYAALNQAKGKKIIYGVPYRGHHLTQQSYRKTWEETVYTPRMEFIKEYLK